MRLFPKRVRKRTRPVVDAMLRLWAWALSRGHDADSEYARYRADKNTLYLVGAESDDPDRLAGRLEGLTIGIVGILCIGVIIVVSDWLAPLLGGVVGGTVVVATGIVTLAVFDEFVEGRPDVEVTTEDERPPLEAI